MTRVIVIAIAIFTTFASVLFSSGCTPSGDLAGIGAPTGLAGEVAAKAQSVAQNIGGANGFGGMRMDGYMDHMADFMGFGNATDLAQAGGHMNVELTNTSGQACTFHIAFISSPEGSNEQTQDATVPAGETLTIDMPCAEMVGMGSLTSVGQMAGQLADGTQIDNHMSVPGFLNSDFNCDGTFSCTLMPDTNDLDQDGDTREFIAVTSAMQSHMGTGGMSPHGDGGGMFGAGMMNGLFSGNGMFGGVGSAP